MPFSKSLLLVNDTDIAIKSDVNDKLDDGNIKSEISTDVSKEFNMCYDRKSTIRSSRTIVKDNVIQGLDVSRYAKHFKQYPSVNHQQVLM